jgi:hypothetical protein
VVETELTKHLVDDGYRATESVETGLRAIQVLTGFKPHVELPTRDDLARAVAARLVELDSRVVRLPITVEQTRRALDRVNSKGSPNGGREQFKDSLIWEAITDAAGDYDIHFITGDGAFFSTKDRDALAEDLASEYERSGLVMHIHKDLETALRYLEPAITPLDEEDLALRILGSVQDSVAAKLDDHGFDLTRRFVEQEVKAFATEQPGRLAVSFQLRAQLHDREVDHEGASRHCYLFLQGQGWLDQATNALTSVTLDRLELRRADDTVVSGDVYLRVGSAYVGGRPAEPLEIRHPIGPPKAGA